MAKISSITVEKVQNFADIVAIASEYMRLENRGGDFWGCCPFHNERTPSFHIIPERNFFHCFGCGKSGSAVTFLMEMEKVSFPEAIETIAKKSGIEIIYEHGEKSDSHLNEKNTIIDVYRRLTGTFNYFLTSEDMGKQARTYTESRGISPEMIEKFKLGFSHPDRFWLKKFLKTKNYSDDFLSKTGLFSKKNPDAAFFSNRLMFPICDRNGGVIAFGARILPPNEGPKYINSAETEIYKKGSTVYAFHLAKQEILKTKTVIFCEGYMDVIAFHQAGICNAVAPLGTALTENQVKMLKSFADTAILCFDTDEAGLQACFKSILLCRKENFEVKIADFSQKFGKKEKIPKDPAEILLNFGPIPLTQIINSAIIDSEFLLTSFLELKGYDVSNSTGRANTSLLFFDYVDSIPSQIQKESALEELSRKLNVSLEAVKKDFVNREGFKRKLKSKTNKNKNSDDFIPINKTAELRALLAVVANPVYFSKLRFAVEPDDFDDENAKNLFIILEDCYRQETMTYDAILLKCNDARLNAVLGESIASGEFIGRDDGENQRIVEDAIGALRKKALCRRRDEITLQIRQLSNENTFESHNALKHLLEEKMTLDSELGE